MIKLRPCQVLYLRKGVSTIPDECRGVGLEISTSSKRKTTNRNLVEDIVSANSDIRYTCVEQQTVMI